MRSSGRKRWIIAAATVFAIVALPLASRRVRGYVFATSGLESYAKDERVMFEPGVVRGRLDEVSAAIDRAADRVVRKQGGSFVKPIRVCVCQTQANYNTRVGDARDGIARGAVFADIVYLSPRTFDTNSLDGILTHELSHLHLRQIMGHRYTSAVPGWFQEGLAVYVSDGGGAEPVSREAAIWAIRGGRQLQPEDRGRMIPRMAADHGLRHHMFYRQAGMFVQDLATDDAAFRQLIESFKSGETFNESFRRSFGRTSLQCWSSFRERLLR